MVVTAPADEPRLCLETLERRPGVFKKKHPDLERTVVRQRGGEGELLSPTLLRTVRVRVLVARRHYPGAAGTPRGRGVVPISGAQSATRFDRRRHHAVVSGRALTCKVRTSDPWAEVVFVGQTCGRVCGSTSASVCLRWSRTRLSGVRSPPTPRPMPQPAVLCSGDGRPAQAPCTFLTPAAPGCRWGSTLRLWASPCTFPGPRPRIQGPPGARLVAPRVCKRGECVRTLTKHGDSPRLPLATHPASRTRLSVCLGMSLLWH